jgi:hypothetical protein
MLRFIKSVVPDPVYREVRWWIMRYAPPPEHVKRRTMRNYIRRYGLKVFVETGTFRGDTTFALRNMFDTVHTIELSVPLYQAAKKRFAHYPNIHLYQGDSAKVLPEIVAKLTQPAFFYLDGHWCGLDTAKTDTNTPILDEVECVITQPLRHIIFIDDARLFIGEDDYPTIPKVTDFVQKLDPTRDVQVWNDMIIIT